MAILIECIPNFSEGRDAGVIEALAAVAGNAPGVALLDYSADADHNRSVFTLLGRPDGVAEAAFLMCRAACALIDMTKHAGGHPRIGATDVIPFVPIRECTIRECVDISVNVAKRIYGELGIPCFLYEESCTRESRRNLADIRKGGFEGLPQKLLLDDWAPDFGERRIHPTAGASAVGARGPLVAFNVNLNTPDISIARKIAKKIRASDGGFTFCKAIGVMLADRGLAQVSMNMVNHEATPLHVVYDTIREEAARLGVSVAGSELIGLAPAKALADCAAHYLNIENYDFDKQVLENHIMKML